MRSIRVSRFILVLVFLVGLVWGGVLIFYLMVMPRSAVLEAQRAATLAPTPVLPADSVYSQLDAMDQIMTTLYQRVSPSVVHITSRTQGSLFYGVAPSEGTGSGFVIDKEGHIVTNNHVIADADQIEVVFANGVSYPAKLVGTDTYYDLAVIQVTAPAEQLLPVEMGDSSQLKIGQTVLAIGNPFGLDRTLTIGIVSALGRRIETDGGALVGQAIQTDAAINPGNSGGPLMDTRGRVVGINAAINSPSGGSVGIGFAVPVNAAKRVVPSLISKGRYPHPSLGIKTFEIGNEISASSNGPKSGLLVSEIDAKGPSAKVGLNPTSLSRSGRRTVATGGDIITAVGGKPIATRNDLFLALEENYQPGDTVKLTVYRDSKPIEVSVVLGQE